MTSHEYAQELQKTAEHLLARPNVKFPNGPYCFVGFYEKEEFVAAVRAMGTGKKEFASCDDLHFTPTGICLTLSIARSKVCRKIQDVKWECMPVLSDEEVQQLGQEQDKSIPF